MSCERKWWAFLSWANAHFAAVEELSRLASLHSLERHSILIFSPDDLRELLDAIARVHATMRDQKTEMEAFFHAWEEHGAVAGDPAIGPAVTW